MTQPISAIDANEVFFGVEIETYCPNRTPIIVGGYHRPVQVPFLPEGWKCSSDCSIHAPRGYKGAEIVSPKLKGADGLRQIQTVCEILKARGFHVNQSTGVHVSVDWGIQDKKTTDRLIAAVSFAERGIYATTGTHGRERGGWCRSVHQYGNVNAANVRINRPEHEYRYHILNLTNLYNGQGRVEFRAFTGSLNALKICAWVQLCIGIVQKAKSGDRIAKWTGSVDANHVQKRFGAGNLGQREYIRVQQFLRWQPALDAKKGAYGKIDGSPYSFAACQNELKRLAKKYDAETHVADGMLIG